MEDTRLRHSDRGRAEANCLSGAPFFSLRELVIAGRSLHGAPAKKPFSPTANSPAVVLWLRGHFGDLFHFDGKFLVVDDAVARNNESDA